MGGCCILALILALGPRICLLCGYFMSNWYDAFDSRLWAVLGWIFMPLTSMSYMYAHFQNGGVIEGKYLVLLIIVVILDLGTNGSSRSSSSSSSS